MDVYGNSLCAPRLNPSLAGRRRTDTAVHRPGRVWLCRKSRLFRLTVAWIEARVQS